MNLVEIIEFLAAASSCVALVFGVATYYSSISRERKVRTYNAIDVLLEKNDELSSKNIKNDYMDFVHFTRNVDRFASSYNAGQFKKSIVKERAGAFLIRIYDEKLSGIILQQRKQFKRDSYFSQLENMIKDLKQ